MYIFGKRSRERLHGVHPDLVIVFTLALSRSDIDFSIIEGMRTLARQKELVAAGASRTMKSRHLTGHAIDIAPYINGQIRWDWPLYNQLSKMIKTAAADYGIRVEWGGDWRTFKDGPHWQLPWRQYPA